VFLELPGPGQYEAPSEFDIMLQKIVMFQEIAVLKQNQRNFRARNSQCLKN